MAIGPRLDLRQTQQLVMTPQLQQAIKLLTLSNLELEAAIGAEIERNPLLEAGDNDVTIEPESLPTTAATELGIDHVLHNDSSAAQDAVAQAPLDVDLNEQLFHHDCVSDNMGATADPNSATMSGQDFNGDGDYGLSASSLGDASGASAGEYSADAFAHMSDEPSLHEFLLAQAGTLFRDPTDYLVAAHLIDLIDDAGYINLDLFETAQRLGTSQAHVEQILLAIQGFEPIGVGARTLGECLALQAREVDRLDPAMAMLLNNLPLLARGELAALKRLCRVDDEDLSDMIREVRRYNPKPGLAYGRERPRTVVADVFVRKTKEGWSVELNGATLPRVLVNQSYHAELSLKARGTTPSARAERQFLSDCLTSANWLVKSLDQRARTILKVTHEIVRQQQGFFDNGVRELRPLTLRTVADAIGMHESTISRVTSAKYLSCSRGLFELKYFFSSSIDSSDGGEAHSAMAVKFRLKQLIDAEAADRILSDDQLVDILRAEKFDIARRTVAKYREAMNIPSSVQRRRLKAYS